MPKKTEEPVEVEAQPDHFYVCGGCGASIEVKGADVPQPGDPHPLGCVRGETAHQFPPADGYPLAAWIESVKAANPLHPGHAYLEQLRAAAAETK